MLFRLFQRMLVDRKETMLDSVLEKQEAYWQ